MAHLESLWYRYLMLNSRMVPQDCEFIALIVQYTAVQLFKRRRQFQKIYSSCKGAVTQRDSAQRLNFLMKDCSTKLVSCFCFQNILHSVQSRLTPNFESPLLNKYALKRCFYNLWSNPLTNNFLISSPLTTAFE